MRNFCTRAFGRLTLRLAVVGALLFAVFAVGAAGAAARTPTASPYPVEDRYKVAGSWAVTTSNVTDASGAVVYQLYYPRNLGAGGFRHPILTWGNGTNASPSDYPGVMNQLASWGFVIVASTDPTEASGAEMMAGVRYLIDRNADPTSVFYSKLDPSEIGAFGHSQGAGGAVNAANDPSGLVKTTVPINLPDYKYVSTGGDFSVGRLRVPVLFLGGSGDKLIAPPTTLQGYYNQVLGASALGVLKSANHNTIQRSGGGYLGYLTAWMMYQLQGDAYARTAFVGLLPEFNVNTNWQDQAEKFLL